MDTVDVHGCCKRIETDEKTGDGSGECISEGRWLVDVQGGSRNVVNNPNDDKNGKNVARDAETNDQNDANENRGSDDDCDANEVGGKSEGNGGNDRDGEKNPSKREDGHSDEYGDQQSDEDDDDADQNGTDNDAEVGDDDEDDDCVTAMRRKDWLREKEWKVQRRVYFMQCCLYPSLETAPRKPDTSAAILWVRDLLQEKGIHQALLASALSHIVRDYKAEMIELGSVTTLFKDWLEKKEYEVQLASRHRYHMQHHVKHLAELDYFCELSAHSQHQLVMVLGYFSEQIKLIALMLRSISLNCQPEIVQLHLFESGQRSQLINRDRKRQAKGRKKSALLELPLEHEVRAPKTAVCSTDANNWQTSTDPDIVLDLPKTDPDCTVEALQVAEPLEKEQNFLLFSLAFVAQQAACVVIVLEHCVSLLASLEYIKVYAEVHANINEAGVDSLPAAAGDWEDSVVNEKDKQQASIISQHDLDWIFNPQSHGVTSAFGGYQELACYPVARYPQNQNALVSLSLQRKLDEMSPREYLTAVLHDLSPEERDSLMVDEKQRRKTFLVNWPHDNNLSGKKMAQAGFYCVDDYDRVQCVFCRGSLHRWEAGENPITEHARSFPFCRFIKGMNCGNGEYMDDVFPVDDLKNITLLCHPVKKRSDGTVCINSSAFGISTIKAQMMRYAPYETRKATFSRWLAIKKISPEKLIEAGFYYTGFDDNVKCFYCAGSLREWEKTDDPWVEHARWFPECSYLIQLKGEPYIDEIHATTPEGKKCSRQTELEKKTAKEYKQRVSVQQAMKEFCLKMGHDKDIIDEVMRLNDGVPYDRPRDMIEMVYKVEDSLLPASDRMDAVRAAPSASFGPKSSNVRPPEESMMSTPCQVKDEEEVPAGACRPCFRRTEQFVQATYIGLPCGHLIYCETCKTREKTKYDNSASYKPKCVSSGCNATLAGVMRCYFN